MNKINRGLSAAVLLFISINAFAAPMEVKRFGIFIGANDGGKGRQRLMYAGDDARKMSETMMDVGGISEDDSILLLNPSADEIRTELENVSSKISRVGTFARRTEVMFYYSGHSDENGILIQEDQILYKEIRDQLDKAGADVVIAVLDSCSSGAITRMKGGQRRSPFLIDDSSSMEGHAFLTSSSEDELSQESDRIGASFFTHYLISGLRGAADSTGDGRVTLNEIYQHTFDETLSQTESTIGGPQHPAYEIQLTGTGDLVLTDLTVPTSALQLSGELEGRFSVRNDDNRLVAEFSKPLGDTLKLALPAGSYTIRMSEKRTEYDIQQEEIMTAVVSLNRNTQLYLTMRDFSSGSTESTRYRGDEQPEENDDRIGKFVFSPVPGINIPLLEPDDKVHIQGGLIGAIAPEVEGLQVSTIFNIVEGDTLGVQASGIFNITEGNMDGLQFGYYGFNMTHRNLRGVQASAIFNMVEGTSQGVQAAAIFNMADETMQGIQGAGIFNMTDGAMQGIQGAGIFNMAGMPSAGIQGAGIFNMAEEIHGIQGAGIFNYASYMKGVQASLVNVAGSMYGLQIGLINISREIHGMPIGLINISRNGVVDVGTWYEYSDAYRLYLSFQSGTNFLFTLFYWGNSVDGFFKKPDNMAWGMHIGSRIPLGFLEFDIDAGLKQSYKDTQRYDTGDFTAVPSTRAIVAIKRIGIYWGVTMDFSYPGHNDSSLYSGKSFDIGSSGDSKGYYKYVFGIRI
ncbi:MULTISPECIES: LA_2272 family surface repeat-containing protein [unclassified Oceanispirochaeta]|uniref:caspase family protein n=1 Tax=unclassified Oceanispirochaeta TaxID=2635722 RepID=UPI0013148E70|nr:MULTISPECIES: caspase family protein [unclassified Oceanispirochaeta]MBF9018863.1 caspase family protein [Oceanispirochaeta sp. M2]NPD75351.1 caspase family protein [Oceanispirochaeta sp. M1]